MIDIRARQLWQDAVLASPDLSPAVRCVAMAIGFAMHIGGQGCYPSYQLIADKSACSRATAIRAVKTLEAKGWLGVARTGGRRANNFTLLMPASLAVPICEEIRQLADYCVGKPATLPESRSDKVDQRREFAALPDDQSGQMAEFFSIPDGQHDTSDRPKEPLGDQLNGSIQKQPLNGSNTDLERLQIAPATVAEPCTPKKKKNIPPYTPRIATYGGGIKSSTPHSPSLLFVEHGTEAGWAWERYWLKTKGKRPPWQCSPSTGYRRGWWFPSEFPPVGQEAFAQ